MKALIISLAFLPLTLFAQPPCDIMIVNGKIIDGTGNNWYYGNIAIKDGKIIAIGKVYYFHAARTIDARGMIVAPGFIDVHTHLEGDEVKDLNATNFILDGVTTCVTGNCGSSNTDIGKYLRWVDSLKLSINVASLIGHNDIRKAVMGRANRDATADEMKRMEDITEKAMKDGAVGLSTGLIYIPGTYTKTPEIVALAKIAGKYNGIYATHMRDEGDSVTFAIEEALTIGREAYIPVEISHFKLSGQHNWGRSKITVPMIEKARKEGIEVTIDQYPYTASSTSISTLIPDEILADGQDSIKARLQRPEVKKYVVKSILDRLKKRKLKHLSYAVIAYFAPDTT
ncbi:MAG: amidohydrolase family protein, partial [Chitinophagaceae bacterium]|nr:amidohydrolase family protein [Chitinophagaceae bacterium]